MALEPISPELVLVAGEEEARLARQQLPELPWEAFQRQPAVVTPAPPRRRRRRAPVATIVLVVIAVAGYLAAAQWSDGRTRPTLETRVSHTQAPAPATTTAPATTATAPTATVAAPAPKPEATFVPARAWAWPPSAGAHAYAITFYLDGRVVLRARPTRALFQL